MRTTLDIADDVLKAVRERARRENKTPGEVISELARAALTADPLLAANPNQSRSLYGIRPFPRRGAVVTNELVDRLREDDTC
jgi:hypothetical protein